MLIEIMVILSEFHAIVLIQFLLLNLKKNLT
jgi:hypothetical protein